MLRPVLAFIITMTFAVPALARPPQDSETTDKRTIDLVICLDTSDSMRQLIDSARAKLWDIVNELGRVEQDVQLRVGLLTYGSPGTSNAKHGWVCLQSCLTSDLDTIYEKMMKITTRGGNEYVGWVLHDALNKMNWSSSEDSLKVIFVCGNESADQARSSFNFRTVALRARSQGVLINAIYAGKEDQGRLESWHEVGQFGAGEFFAIDTARGTIQITAPQDQQLALLNTQLNGTYVPYGVHGQHGVQNQIAQDGNALSMGSQTNASRAISKSGKHYYNANWDLVDACNEDDFELYNVKPEHLPQYMQGMSQKERQEFIEVQRAKRKVIQEEIQKLAKQRAEFLKHAYEKSNSGQAALDEAIRRALRKQAKTKGLTFLPHC